MRRLLSTAGVLTALGLAFWAWPAEGGDGGRYLVRAIFDNAGFVVLPGGGVQLNPANYTRFGEVVEGQDVVDAIGQLGNAQQEPTEVVLINSVTITESPA